MALFYFSMLIFKGPEASALKQFTRTRRVPLPAELVEHFGHMQCNCNMGIFPQVIVNIVNFDIIIKT